ncbi:jg24485 [Pararge aegeria aegeria]|uniref:Jg24485 protein n=2 Tax=Pararge aegeria TaxID=116150 RepID=A0A8S4RER3_9NEOP|nr:jg24485 [Pararge aegeria aegeria]
MELNAKGCPKDTMIFKILPHDDCNKFYKCSNGEPYEFKCPETLMFNLNESVCDWPNQVDCGNRKLVTPTPETNDDDDAVSVCAREGSDGLLVAHEYCNHLYMCARGLPVDITCPEPLLFNTDSKLCDWESQVDCGDRLKEKESESQEK